MSQIDRDPDDEDQAKWAGRLGWAAVIAAMVYIGLWVAFALALARHNIATP